VQCKSKRTYRSDGSRLRGREFSKTAGPKMRMATNKVASAASLYSKPLETRRSLILTMRGISKVSAAVGACGDSLV